MVDCSKTKNYLVEKARMTKRYKYGGCQIECTDCPLSWQNNGTSESMMCATFEANYPEQAISIIQKWSDENPQKTYLTELLKVFPNTQVNAYGIPKRICPFDLGLMSAKACRKDRNCAQCWNQPLLEREEVK